MCRSRERQHNLSNKSFTFSECRSCKVVYQSHRPVENDIAIFYPNDYGPYQVSGRLKLRPSKAPGRLGRLTCDAIVRVAQRINNALIRRHPDPLPAALNDVYSPTRPRQVLLDFGCGSEAFLNQARDRGWKTIGIDFVPSVVEAVRLAGHEALLVTPKMWDDISDQSVDAIRMNHVVEHLYDPVETLTQLRRILRPGGRLHAATPNAKSLTFRLLRRNWFPLECPRHVVLYTPKSLRRLLTRVGFESVQCFNEVLTKDTARSLGYWLQEIGLIDRQSALGMIDRPTLHAALYTPARIAALYGRADRFHVVATASR